jgi:hypothetical protein
MYNSVEWSLYSAQEQTEACRVSVRGVVEKHGIDRLIHQTSSTQPARGNKEQARDERKRNRGERGGYIYVQQSKQAGIERERNMSYIRLLFMR